MDDLSKAYLALGLQAGASLDEIKQAYRDLVKVWHPDRFGHDERLRLMAQDKLKEINGAYEFLQAYSFDASIAPDQATTGGAEATSDDATSTEPPPAPRSRVALWVTLGVLVLAMIGTAAIFFSQKGRGKKSGAPVSSKPVSGATTTYALNFYRDNGHLAIATTGSLTGTFTVELWALTRKPRLGQTILSSRGPGDYGFDIKFRQGKMFHAGIGDGSRWLVTEANATYSYTKEAWYHIAYVVTPTNYTAYINGELTASGAIQPPGNPVLYDATHQLRFGMDALTPEDLEGNVAEVRIWKTARTQEEILTNRKRELAGDEPGLQGYWRFAHATGRETPDLSGHGFTGTFISTASLNTNGPPIVGR